MKITLKDMWQRDKSGFVWFGLCMVAVVMATIQRDYLFASIFAVCGLLFVWLSWWFVKTKMIHEEIRRRENLIMTRWFEAKFQNDPKDS